MNPLPAFDGLSIDAARRSLAAHLSHHGIAGAAIEARLLMSHVTGFDLTAMIAHGGDRLDADSAYALSGFAERRVAGEPVARLTGEQEFHGLRVLLSPATLIPRSDTETLVEVVLASVYDKTAPLRIADLGTGTGAILVALLTELPNASGVGTDLSDEALATATENAARHGVSDRASFILSDYASRLDGVFDLIVSNPPYIRSGDIETLATEVRDHDPRLALDGGADGLDAYRTIASQADALLAEGGKLSVEIGLGQAADVTQILKASGLMPANPPRPDLAGIPRVVQAQKPRRQEGG